MGSSVSVPLAEIVMQEIENQICSNSPYPIKFWRRYMDDVIAIVPKKESKNILNFINSIDRNIQFEMEEENENKLPFLDLYIIRTPSGTFKFSIYRKPTNTETYLNFDSYNPKNHKVSVVKSLIDRAFNLCSEEYLEEEIDTIKKSMKNNGYNAGFVNRIISQKRNSILLRNNSGQNNNNRNSDIKYVAAPYIKGVSEIMNRSLKKFNIVLSNKTTNTLRSELCKLKDRTADEDKCNCVYKINCGDCNKFYLGETGRSVSKRVYEHKYNVTCKNVNSQIFQHVIENNHRIDFSNVHIIHQNSNWKQRKFIESCFTTSYPDSFNRCEEISETILPCIQDICKRVGI